MRRASSYVILCVLFGISACSRSSATREPPPAPPAPSDAPSSVASVQPGSPPAATKDKCAEIRTQFNDVHAKRTDKCATDADCACFNPIGGPQLGCGGVTDAATAKELSAIEKSFHAESCRFTHNCAAWSCVPKCTAGRCSR